jgi:phosphoribosylanthranilate isomerase
MLIQIYETRSPQEATALAAAGVDHVGVLVGAGEFPREIPPDRARKIFAAVLPPAKRVALSLSADPEAIARVVAEARPDIIHLGAAAELMSPPQVRGLRERFPGVAVMRSIPVTGVESVAIAAAYRDVADFLLLDSHAPGDRQIGAQGRTHDWAVSRRIVAEIGIPAVLAGGLGPDNVAAAIAAVGPDGVDSKTLTDRADGSAKDLDLVRRFAAAAKMAVRLTS